MPSWCEGWIGRLRLHNIDIVFGCFNEPIIQVCITCKEFHIVLQEIIEISRASMLSNYFTESIVGTSPFDVVFFWANFNQAV